MSFGHPLGPPDPDDPRQLAAHMTAVVSARICSAYEAKITDHTVARFTARMSGQPEPMLFTTPDEMEQFSSLALIAATAELVQDAPAARAAYLAMGLPQLADMLEDEGLNGHGRIERLMANGSLTENPVAETGRKLLAGELAEAPEVPDFPPEAA